MNSLNSLNYSNNSNYQQPKISASTKRKLESLGIDPTLVASESQAQTIIKVREVERSFREYDKPQELNINEELINPTENSESIYSAMSYQANNIRYLLGL